MNKRTAEKLAHLEEANELDRIEIIALRDVLDGHEEKSSIVEQKHEPLQAGSIFEPPALANGDEAGSGPKAPDYQKSARTRRATRPKRGRRKGRTRKTKEPTGLPPGIKLSEAEFWPINKFKARQDRDREKLMGTPQGHHPPPPEKAIKAAERLLARLRNLRAEA